MLIDGPEETAGALGRMGGGCQGLNHSRLRYASPFLRSDFETKDTSVVPAVSLSS